MTAQAWIITAGWFNLGFAIFHAAFWWVFRWRSDLPRLRPANRVIMQVLNLMLTYVFGAMALMQLCWPEEIAAAPAGRMVLAAMTGFWVLRAALQWMFRGIASGRVQAVFYGLFVAGAVLHARAWLLAQ